jgi:valyl-tRNA synthetase
MEISRVYEPQLFEPRWAQWWIDSGIFIADPRRPGRYFSLVIPPPNVTGVLHMGHMLDHTIIDVAVRWHRMLGDNTLWVPGTDHAGIATQMVVERELAKEGLTRHDLGRAQFEQRVWQWKEASGNVIKKQMIRLGASCDWTRERFTLDEGLSRAVRDVFVRLFEKGLIYRGEYMVNWCPRCHTALSDLETVHQPMAGKLWHIAYPLKNSSERLVVATTRPETMLGDAALAVNPQDSRYSHLIGATAILPLMDREIPVIADEFVDMQFGTGVVKVTPAHDLHDFEAAKRHNLPHFKVIDEAARMTAAAGAYCGLDRFAARERVVADLEKLGLLVKVEPYEVSAGSCQRCKTIVEPLVSTQWFVKTKPLAEPAIRVVEDGRIQFIPDSWTKTYFEWMYNIRDWCISRQLWWGHRIPAWHCRQCGQVTVARQQPSVCAYCGSSAIEQDPDVLDTWFSSGLWPFSTLGWPEQTEDFKRYYPTTLLVTGFDIIFFWVARMIMLGLECTGDVPFRQVYFHGLVRDAERQKMSKTKGNVIDPLEITEKYGTDAVRLALVQGAAAGNDIALSEGRIESTRAFANKVWNAARLIFLNMERSAVDPWLPPQSDIIPPESLAQEGAPLEDRWIFSRLNRCAEQVNRHLESHRYHEAAHQLWHFFWHEFCDWYLEIKKLRLEPASGLDAHWRNLLTAFEAALRLLHPFMPFLTEELWQRLAETTADRPRSIAVSHYPQANPAVYDEEAERQMQIVQDVVTAIREVRADLRIEAHETVQGILSAQEALPALAAFRSAIERLARAQLDLVSGPNGRRQGVRRSTPAFDLIIHVPTSQLDAQRARLQKEIEQLERNIAHSRRQLADENFLRKAPPHVVESLRNKLAAYEVQLQKHREALNA